MKVEQFDEFCQLLRGFLERLDDKKGSSWTKLPLSRSYSADEDDFIRAGAKLGVSFAAMAPLLSDRTADALRLRAHRLGVKSTAKSTRTFLGRTKWTAERRSQLRMAALAGVGLTGLCNEFKLRPSQIRRQLLIVLTPAERKEAGF